MYTQCPHCGSAFRVTAEVLKQAAGKVRCGACGNAFNALAHLSESKPEPEPVAPAVESGVPELKPEPAEVDTPDLPPPPTAISPEQGAALLKTLDNLAGDEIQLEDTGIEWRLLDEGGDARGPGKGDDESTLGEVFDDGANNGTERVDEILTSTATPVDEVLDAGGATTVESAEVFDADASETVPDEELRFDDNTGLPDDFSDDDGPSQTTSAVPEPVRDAPEPMANLQVDLGFGDEWQDLLEEVGPGESPAAAADSEPTLADELEALDIPIDDDARDDEAIPDGDELASRMEALSLELSGIQEELDMLTGESDEPSLADELDALEVDLDEPEDDADPAVAGGEDNDVPGPDEVDPDEVLVLELDDESDDEVNDELGDEPVTEAEALAEEEPRAEADEQEHGAPEGDDESETIAASADEEGDASVGELDLEAVDEADAGEDSSIDDDLLAAAFETERAGRMIETAEPAEQHVPEPTEEEETINRLIDQELLALAVEDDDGFASTIVVGDAASDDTVDDGIAASGGGLDIPGLPADAEVEEIVMEGAVARSGTDLEEQEAEEAALKEEAAALIAAATAEDETAKKPVNWGLVAGIVVLVLLLALQAIHFSRNALARSPAVNDVLSPVYALFGAPLTPAWDVTGWRFEATRGSTDESGAVLSVYSRIGNRSEDALPYPVISVSLTDRFEETIGSRVFEPAEYLSGDLDTRYMVEPGTSFNALMSIESPAAEATGFKLNVCYRITGQELRCAIEDFK